MASAADSSARARRAQARARQAVQDGRWDSALKQSKLAVAAAEEAVALADRDDDVVLLAQALAVKSQVHDSLRDGDQALSAAREAMDVYSRLDRELNNPQRVTRRLGDDSVLFSPGQGALKDRFAALYAETANLQLDLAELIAKYEAETGEVEARRLAEVAFRTFQELAQHSSVYVAKVDEAAARREAMLGSAPQAMTTEELTRRAAQSEDEKSTHLKAREAQAETYAERARDDYAARRYADAVENMRVAVEAYRELAAHVLWHKRQLARALFDYAHHLEAHGSRSAAVRAMREAGLLFSQVHEQNDHRFAGKVALCSRELRHLRLMRLGLRPRRRFVAPLAL
ncbi:hypothetical protein [Kribbella sp. NPDC055071]